MARHWHRLALATACASWFVVTACSSHAGSASAGYRTSTHVVDHHAVDAAWSTLLPPMPAGWQVAHTPEELTLQQAEAVFPAGSHLASELSFAGFLRGVRRAIGGDGTCGGRMAVEERLFQFKTAGGAAEWFTELVGSVYPMVGSPVAKLSPVEMTAARS